MDPNEGRMHRYRRSASRVSFIAHLFGILSIMLLLVWLLLYREGLDLNSDNYNRIFNVHPFLMFFGFIFMMGEAMMAYNTVGAERRVQKNIHAFVHFVAIILGIVGLHAAFKYHEKHGLTNLYSLHSWIGIGTFSLFCLQWLFGVSMFLSRGISNETRARAALWHVNGGRVIMLMAICAALTGLMEKVTYMGLRHQSEARVINFLGLAILLFGISVDLCVSLRRYA